MNIQLEENTGRLCSCGEELEKRAFKEIGSSTVPDEHYYCPKCGKATTKKDKEK